MIARMTLVVVAASLTLPMAGAIAQERSFACENGNPSDTKEVLKRSNNFSMQLIMGIYANRWDATYIREQCEAYVSGQPYTITCIADVRDWDEIEASIPDDYYGMDRFALAEFVPAERENGSALSQSYEYCREVGAIE